MEELAPVATLIVATVALYVGLRTVRQRDLADRRAQWWERFRWATELARSDDEESRQFGLDGLELLVSSRLAGPEELDLLEVGMTAALRLHPDLLDDTGVEEDDGGDRDGEGRVDV